MHVGQIIQELTRRRVTRTLGAYLVGLWLLAQGVADLFPAFGLPDWTVPAFVLGGVMGLPLVAFLSWRYNLTWRGVVRDCPRPSAAGWEEDIPADSAKWARLRHNLEGTGYLQVSWLDERGLTRCRQFCEAFVVGRDVHNEVQIGHPGVSRRHVVLWAEQGSWHARDLHSSNGTFINGKAIESARLPSSCSMQLDQNGPVIELSVGNTEPTVVSDAPRTDD